MLARFGPEGVIDTSFFFFNDTATTEIYTLSLHDALPIWLEPDGTGQVHTDFAQIERVQALLQPAPAVLAVGAGTVTDVAKHACYCYAHAQAMEALPFVVYQTANSVSAYTSNMAPVF